MRSLEPSTVELCNLQSVHDAIFEIRETIGWKSKPFWRGHGVEDWSLLPEVFRSESYDESSMLWEFISRGSVRTKTPPPVEDHIGWLHLAQHFGLPTRLLDWTYSILIALYFATENSDHLGKDGAIWALDPLRLNQAQIGDERLQVTSSLHVANMVKPALFPSPSVGNLPDAIAIAAHENDLRLLMQQSVFTLHTNGVDLRDIETVRPVLRKFIVPSGTKRSLRAILSNLGVSRASLFPDLAGLAAELKASSYS